MILTFGSLVGCLGQTESTFVSADHYKTRKFDVAIFPSDYIELFSGPSFTPTRQDIERAELSLRKNLEQLNQPFVNQTPKTIIHKNLNKYKRQYFGSLGASGQRFLIINCFWVKKRDKTTQDWLKQRISVLDGGSYYWQVKFNLDTGELFDLNINGHG